jgi:HK97 family phage major capsid protein
MNKPLYRAEFESAEQFFSAVVAADSGARTMDGRLSMQAVPSGQYEFGGANGGFLVPQEFAEALWAKTYQVGQILNRCSRLPVTKNEISLPAISETSRDDGSRFGGLHVDWTDEAAPAVESKINFAMMRLQLHKLLGVAWATDELLSDAPALAAVIQRCFAMEAGWQIENLIFNGAGVGTPLGIFRSPALITVAAEESQAAATISPANITSMAKRLWGPSHANAVWLTSNDGFGQIAESSFASGSAVVTYGPAGQKFIMGMPLLLSEYPQALGNQGDIVLCDLSQYILAEREQSFLSSIHVRFIEDETAFRFRWRCDGQPGWATSLTPRNSDLPQSPFVTLAAR